MRKDKVETVREAFDCVLVVISPGTGRIYRACFVQVEADVYMLFKVFNDLRMSRNRLLNEKFAGRDAVPSYISVQYSEDWSKILTNGQPI